MGMAVGVLFLGNSFAQQLVATGAFEINLNGEEVFSKLKEGRMPTVEELVARLEAAGLGKCNTKTTGPDVAASVTVGTTTREFTHTTLGWEKKGVRMTGRIAESGLPHGGSSTKWFRIGEIGGAFHVLLPRKRRSAQPLSPNSPLSTFTTQDDRTARTGSETLACTP